MKKILVSLFVLPLLLASCKKEIETKVIKTDKTTVVTKANTRLTFAINGMTCAMGCAATIQEKLSKTAGVAAAEVNFDKKIASVAFDNTIVKKDALLQLVTETGDGTTYRVAQVKEQKM